MDFSQIKLSALHRSDEEVGDEFIDKVVSDGVNEGYRLVATLVDKQVKDVDLTYSQVIDLPSDMHEINEITVGDVILSEIDYSTYNKRLRIDNKDYKSGTFNLIYSSIPTALSLDTDIPVVDARYHNALSTYGAYYVMLYKKKTEIADRIRNEFLQAIGLGGE